MTYQRALDLVDQMLEAARQAVRTMRNVLGHAYVRVDFDTIWQTV
ncbi:HepT-like ribonuclease domain-containing protein [Sandaracinobacteroides saxicola]|nr:HepT-like ribonuclease domain-containing protein [Sandaracinobacteroides saxicola]